LKWFDCKGNVNGNDNGNGDSNGNGNSNSKANGNGDSNIDSKGDSNSVDDSDDSILAAALLHCPLLPKINCTFLNFALNKASAADKATCCHCFATDSHCHGG
jgi:hypothetical protein